MKILKKVLLWMCLGIFIEISLLWYVDRFVLDKNINIKITKLEDKDRIKKYGKDFKIPKSADDVKISYDGNYICYREAQTLRIAYIKDGSAKEIPFYSKDNILNYQWVINRERIIILEQEEESKRIKLSYYDVKKNIKEEIAHLTWTQEKCTGSQIKISPVVEIIYIKIDEGRNSKIYSVDLMKNVKEIELGETLIGNILVVEKNNMLVYENLKEHTIMYHVDEKNNNILSIKDYRIWSTDSKGNVYFYKAKDGKVYDIVYTNNIIGKEFKSLNLKESYKIEDIYMNSSGEIYFKREQAGRVINIFNHKEFKYNGSFVGFYDSGFIYEDKLGGLNKVSFN